MLKKSTLTALASAVVGLGMLFITPTLASAGVGGGSVGYSHGNTHVELRIGHGPRVIKRKHGHREYHDRTCRPGKAVYNAERHGLRDAHIGRIGHRFIVVTGRQRGHFVKMGFDRHSPRCSLAWVKSEPRYHHRRGYGYRY